MPQLTEIDDLSRSDHYYLDESDGCVFLRSYLSGKGYSGGKTNQLILNFKIPPSVQNANPIRWPNKVRAIKQIVNEFEASFNDIVFDGDWTFVPIPPSKHHEEPEYDNRLTRMLLYMCRNHPRADVRELILQTESTSADHEPSLMSLPGSQEWWQTRKHWYTDGFQNLIDSLIETPDAKAIFEKYDTDRFG